MAAPPNVQFGLIGVDGSGLTAVNGQALLTFPTRDRADTAPEIGRNFLPRVKAIFSFERPRGLTRLGAAGGHGIPPAAVTLYARQPSAAKIGRSLIGRSLIGRCLSLS